MSAFVISTVHLNSIVTAAMQHQVTAYDTASADYLGCLLLRENVRSVLHRYSASASPSEREHYDALIANYRFERTAPVSPARAAKLLDCFDYQACECEDYPRSDAAAFVSQMRAALLRRLPGYDAAPWAID